MRRRERSEKHSLTCTPEEWERLGARASRRGLSSSAYVVECALAVDPASPGAKAAARDEMRALLETAERIEKLVSALAPEAPSVLDSVAARIGFLTRRAMLEMMHEGRDDEIVSLLAIRFGEDKARELVDAFRESLAYGAGAT